MFSNMKAIEAYKYIDECRVIKSKLKIDKDSLIKILKDKNLNDLQKAEAIYELWKLTGENKYRKRFEERKKNCQ